MTRWVRSGSTQKHKKMPGDATKWGEFDNQNGNNKIPEKVKTQEVDEISKPDSVSQTNALERENDESYERKGKKIKIENNRFKETDSVELKQENTFLLGDINASADKTCSLSKSFFDQDCSVKKRKKAKHLKLMNAESESEKAYTSACQNETSFVAEPTKYVNELNNKPIKKLKLKKKKKKARKQYSQEAERRNLNSDAEASEDPSSTENKTSFLEKEFMHSTTTSACQNETSFVAEPANHVNELNNKPIKKLKLKKKKKKALKQYSQEAERRNLNSDAEASENTPSTENKTSFLQKEFMHSTTTPSKKEKMKMHLKPCSQDSESKELNIESEVPQISPSQNESPEKTSDNPGDDSKKKERKRWKKSKHENDMQSSSAENSPSKVHAKKKERQLQRLRKKREAQGILLLPPKVEQKLYRIKKTLREKGIPPENLKQIIREERRKAELEYRKINNPSKLCFHCRESGHLFADCPRKSDSMKQETGICFKCGSPDHVSFKCPEKIKGFPLAKCFICKEQGHISRDCPRNKHGVYPKGGRCNICGNVNHLKKDCPSLIKQKEAEESEVTLHTINGDTSIDAEIIPKEDLQKKHSKKPKIVKF